MLDSLVYVTLAGMLLGLGVFAILDRVISLLLDWFFGTEPPDRKNNET